MGGNITKPLGGELMGLLKKDYEKFTTLGYGDLIIQQKLEERYKNFLLSKGLSSSAGDVVVNGESAQVTQDLDSTVPSSVVQEPVPDLKPQSVSPQAETPAPESSVPQPSVPAPVATTAAKPVISKNKAKPAASVSTTKKSTKKQATRRRSFEPDQSPSATEQMLLTSASAAILPPSTEVTNTTETTGAGESHAVSSAGSSNPAPAPPEAAVPQDLSKRDNWDSVSEMPFCDVCKTAFKTPGLLDRHVKYSELHAKNAEKAATEAAASGVTVGVAASPAVEIRKAVEGVDFKLLYFGSKFFWRSQDNIDISIFHHFNLVNCLEVVPFDPTKNRALPRLYLDMEKLKAMIKDDLVKARVDASKKHASKSKFSQPSIDDDALLRKTLTSAVLSRLTLLENGGQKCAVFQTGLTETKEKSPLLPAAPVGLVPTTVSHRRNTSTEEVKAKLADLELSKAELAKATSRAESVLSHVQSFAKKVKSEFIARSKMSVPRKRWIMAINRVLQINGVAKTTQYLQKLEMAKKTSGLSPGGRNRREKQKSYA